MNNEFLEEIWRTRKDIENEEGGDLKRVFKRMQKKTNESPRKHYSGNIRTKKTLNE
ncbi:MAG: hypothetical protein GF344_11950 [Chitinivibrionales bacterium]|nr:hypothetical protein [Chitinivibrionales bacterium]